MISTPASATASTPLSSPYAVFRAEEWMSHLQTFCAAPVRGHPQSPGPRQGSVLVQGELFEFMLPAPS